MATHARMRYYPTAPVELANTNNIQPKYSRGRFECAEREILSHTTQDPAYLFYREEAAAQAERPSAEAWEQTSRSQRKNCPKYH
jgi:hypothetical protein